MKKEKIAIGMSGGVDSSVSAWILKQQGYDVIGIFMKNWHDYKDQVYCTIKKDWMDVVSVGDAIGIDVEMVDFSNDYNEKVFKYFLNEYNLGNTPNPDIICNSEIKFRKFLYYALSLGFNKIATGHYAQIIKDNNKYILLKGNDITKDQSYFLYRLNQYQLKKTIFPIGGLKKSDVRKLAIKIGLPNAKKKDSTGICFIGKRPFRDFLRKYISINFGPIKTLDEKIIGQHIGLPFYTIGQRRGIGLSIGNKKPLFVVKKNVISNTLYVAQGNNHPNLFSKVLYAYNASWISGKSPNQEYLYSAKTRYYQINDMCKIYPISKFCINNTFKLIFLKSQWAVTPGQSVVIYNKNICLGGGFIKSK